MTTMPDRLFPVSEDGRDVVLTPAALFEALAVTFDVDVAAALDGDFVPAATRYTIHDDGLSQPWRGRVWMNPPYSNPQPWVTRFIEHGHGIALLPVSRARWQLDLWAVADGIALPRQPFSFHGRNGFPFPVHLAAFGADCVAAAARWGVVRVLEGREKKF